MDFIELNKFSHLHDEQNIIFCKTDFLREQLREIEKLGNDVVLITGNSDYPITDDYLNFLPKNVIKWFGQNIISKNSIFEPIPLGLENKLESVRKGHGIGYYERANIKEKLLLRQLDVEPSKNIYANFKIETNFSHRNLIKNICIKSNHVDWNEPNLSLDEFFTTILEYKMVVCPAGNGVDTHRLWEVLYSNRIPITIKVGNYKIYELYNKLPIIVLESIKDLENEELIMEKYNELKDKKFTLQELDLTYWIQKIKKTNL